MKTLRLPGSLYCCAINGNLVYACLVLSVSELGYGINLFVNHGARTVKFHEDFDNRTHPHDRELGTR